MSGASDDRKRAQARERRRRHVARAKAGLVMLDIVVHAGDTADLLREAGFIDPLSEDTPAVLAAGVEKMIRGLIITRAYTDSENVPV